MATTYVTQSGGLWVPVPLSKPATAVNSRGTRTEATRKALTFKTRRGGKDCVVLEAPDSHRMATTNPSSQVGAWALHCCESTQWPEAEQSGSRTARVRRVHSVKTSSFADSISCPLPRGMSTTVRACHPHDGRVSCVAGERGLFVCLFSLLLNVPFHTLVYFRDGSARTILRAATLRQKLQIKAFHLTQSQHTDTGPTSPRADPITPGARQGSHWNANV